MLLSLLLLGVRPAMACGGLFCANPSQPIDQAAERILFAFDEEAGVVDMQVQLSYTGTAATFAWVLPVPTTPTIATTVDDVFNILADATRPTWTLAYDIQGTCYEPPDLSFGCAQEVSLSGSAPSGSGAVEVAAAGTVGPYETAVLRADDPDALLEWLQENAYNIPDDASTRLAPYVAGGSMFVALRLRSGLDTGDIVPVELTWPATTLTIPLQLTAIAAQPDLALQVYVLGSARAAASNYLDVQINELAIDWDSGGANYASVVAAAADEAGGHAFVTEFAQPVTEMRKFWSPGMYDPDAVRGGDRAVDVLARMVNDSGIPLSTGTVPIVLRFLRGDIDGVRQQTGGTSLQILQNLANVPGTAGWMIDADGLADALEAEWMTAMRHDQDLFERHQWLTRLSSTISPEEMTLDPQFVLNADLPAVDNMHRATMVTHCGASRQRRHAPVELVLEDGRHVALPAGTRFMSAVDLGDAGSISADRISEIGASGDAVVLQDNRAEIDAAIAAGPVDASTRRCDDAGGSRAGLGLLGLVVVLRRRRAQRARLTAGAADEGRGAS